MAAAAARLLPILAQGLGRLFAAGGKEVSKVVLNMISQRLAQSLVSSSVLSTAAGVGYALSRITMRDYNNVLDAVRQEMIDEGTETSEDYAREIGYLQDAARDLPDTGIMTMADARAFANEMASAQDNVARDASLSEYKTGGIAHWARSLDTGRLFHVDEISRDSLASVADRARSSLSQLENKMSDRPAGVGPVAGDAEASGQESKSDGATANVQVPVAGSNGLALGGNLWQPGDPDILREVSAFRVLRELGNEANNPTIFKPLEIDSDSDYDFEDEGADVVDRYKDYDPVIDGQDPSLTQRIMENLRVLVNSKVPETAARGRATLKRFWDAASPYSREIKTLLISGGVTGLILGLEGYLRRTFGPDRNPPQPPPYVGQQIAGAPDALVTPPRLGSGVPALNLPRLEGVCPLQPFVIHVNVLTTRRGCDDDDEVKRVCLNGVREVEALAHNAEMHAQNGNTQSMAAAVLEVKMDELVNSSGLITQVSTALATTNVSGPTSYAMDGAFVVGDRRRHAFNVMGTSWMCSSLWDDRTNGGALISSQSLSSLELNIDPVEGQGGGDWVVNPAVSKVLDALNSGEDPAGALRITTDSVNGSTASDALYQIGPQWSTGYRPCNVAAATRVAMGSMLRRLQNRCAGVAGTGVYPIMPTNDDALAFSGRAWERYTNNTVDTPWNVVARIITLGEYFRYRRGTLVLEHNKPDGTPADHPAGIAAEVFVPVTMAMSASGVDNRVWMLNHMAYPFKEMNYSSKLKSVFNGYESGSTAVSKPLAAMVTVNGAKPGNAATNTPADALHAVRVFFVLTERKSVRPTRIVAQGDTARFELFANKSLTGINSLYGQDLDIGAELDQWNPTCREYSVACVASARRLAKLISQEEALAAMAIAADCYMVLPKPVYFTEGTTTSPVFSPAAMIGAGGLIGGIPYTTTLPITSGIWTTSAFRTSYTTPSGQVFTVRDGGLPTWQVADNGPDLYMCVGGGYMAPARPATVMVNLLSGEVTLYRNALKLTALCDTLAQRAGLPYITLFGGHSANAAIDLVVPEFIASMQSWWRYNTFGLAKPLYAQMSGLSVPVPAATASEPIARADLYAHSLAGTIKSWTKDWAVPMPLSYTDPATGIARVTPWNEAEMNGVHPLSTVILNSDVDATDTTVFPKITGWGLSLDGTDSRIDHLVYPGYQLLFSTQRVGRGGINTQLSEFVTTAPIVLLQTGKRVSAAGEYQLASIRTVQGRAVEAGTTVADRSAAVVGMNLVPGSLNEHALMSRVTTLPQLSRPDPKAAAQTPST